MNKAIYVHKIFTAIARQYDFLNSLLSLRFDRSWRRSTARASGVSPGSKVLDVCTGTGELALAYADEMGTSAAVIGTDFCFEMLAVGKTKVEKQERPRAFVPIEADTLSLPFAEETFDVVSVGFGIRNVADLERGIREMARVAVSGGRVVILEFTQPNHRMFTGFYYFYFTKVLPCIGNLVSKNRDDAYGYLPQSVMQFPDCEELARIMRSCELEDVRFYRKTFGIVAIHVGRKK
ncbi:MAG: bifunctional demethylmenaquinone methyltransferase/2-methoxy-6-polyprenyl-1,4-benzoquinol methylase UbiE [Candidatus Poribacteria bacterium]|nr:bifunctional demethylmenaquinone methyltransferase/2-methoxy-6-polyprenyl-1,4-benzoquinol methylase UbiE [Candidatus Poribacteria bacterium]MDE0506843.1 bifunctional demethylmenaquinone methyltransferase/2-methoxy-6-polyprenyl-1,4-benzoquinol methylase UbiE [Candidatus Poribacteria bacterium]